MTTTQRLLGRTWGWVMTVVCLLQALDKLYSQAIRHCIESCSQSMCLGSSLNWNETVDICSSCLIPRFHILCAHLLCEEDISAFDPRMNNENLIKCLLSLKEFYHDIRVQKVWQTRSCKGKPPGYFPPFDACAVSSTCITCKNG